MALYLASWGPGIGFVVEMHFAHGWHWKLRNVQLGVKESWENIARSTGGEGETVEYVASCSVGGSAINTQSVNMNYRCF